MSSIYIRKDGALAIVEQEILENMKTRLTIEFKDKLIFDDFDLLTDEDVMTVIAATDLYYVGEL